jgi:leucyl-tRNA synthetase
MGFHISGTPVLAVADALSRGDAKQAEITRAAIAEYVSDEAEQDQLLQDFCDPYKIASFFSERIEETFDTLGLSIDWSKKFSTGDAAYQRFVQWQFCSLERCGILEQGRYPILYSPEDKNAVGEDDIKDGDLDKVTILEMSFVLFEILDLSPAEGDLPTYFAVATLRPDALFGVPR